MEEQLNQNIQQQVDEIVDAKKNEIEEFKKKDNKELLDNYASILSTMADLLGIEVYPGIENEDPYSIHYNLSDADKELFVQLQSTVDSIKQAEPSIEQDYEEVDSRINDIRSEMGDIVNEKGEPGIEYYDITSIQDPGKRDRFKELSEKLGEIRKDYPNLFTNEKIVTYAPNGEEIEATDLSEDQEELTDDLRKMSDADLDNNIKTTSDNLTRLLNEKERRAKERAEDMVETVEEAQKDEEKAEEEIKQDEEEIKQAELFSGDIGEGMPSVEEQFEQATGIKFDPEKHEIIYSGAMDDGYDNPFTPFTIVEKTRKEEKKPEEPQFEEVEIFSGDIGEGMPSVEDQIKNAGINFDPAIHTIVYDGAMDDGYDNPFTPFKVVEKRPLNKGTETQTQNTTEPTKQEPQWDPRLTEEQIDYARSKDIYEPVGPEYEQFLNELGLGDLSRNNQTPQEPPKPQWDPRLTEEQIDYARSKDIYEPVGPEYEQFLGELGLGKPVQQPVQPTPVQPVQPTPVQPVAPVTPVPGNPTPAGNGTNGGNPDGGDQGSTGDQADDQNKDQDQQQTQTPDTQTVTAPVPEGPTPEEPTPEEPTPEGPTTEDPGKTKKSHPVLKFAAKSALGAGGFIGGFVSAQSFPIVGGLITGAKVATFVGKKVNCWAKKHPDKKIAGVINGVTSKVSNKFSPEFKAKVAAARAKFGPYINTFVNGFSVGYVTGQIWKNFLKPTLRDDFKMPFDKADPYAQGDVGLNGANAVDSMGNAIPTEAQDALSKLAESGKNFEFVNTKVDEAGRTLWGLAKDGHFAGYFNADEVMELAEVAAKTR